MRPPGLCPDPFCHRDDFWPPDADVNLVTGDTTWTMPDVSDHATPSPSPMPTPSPTPSVPEVESSVDRGEGATCCKGNDIQVCTDVTCPTYVYLYKVLEGQPPVLFASGTTAGSECHWFSVGEPEGVHTLRVEAVEGGDVVGSDETWFIASSCAY